MGFLEDAVSAVGNGVKKVANSAGREVERIGKEHVEHISEDFDSISRAIDNGGFLGGAIQAADVFSPGHILMNEADAFNIVPENEALKNGLSGAINLGLGGPFGLVALKDAYDVISALPTPTGLSGMSPNTPGLAPQSPPPPAIHDRGAIVRGYPMHPELGHGWDGHRAEPGRNACGHGIGRGNSLVEAMEKALARLRDKMGANGRGKDDLEKEIEKLLSNPNLCFEDMIFLLMRAFIKDTRNQVSALTRELRSDTKSSGPARDAMDVKVKAARATLEKAREGGDPAGIQRAENNLNTLLEQRTTTENDRQQSRADRFEDLKQIMQKLSEMEQALSNVLNTMHEGAMSAIRNIR